MMLTSEDQMGRASLCQKMGISALLVKPVRQSELLDAICKSLHHPPNGTIREPLRSHHHPRPVPHRSRILVAEDNAVNQKLVLRLLEKEGYQASVVSDGRAAIAALEAEHFDLVLMDVQMPGMDGLETTAAIREKEKLTGERTPIVAMTACALKGYQERCLAAGMDSYVSTPIRPDELYRTIQNAIEAGPQRPRLQPEEAVTHNS